jgi:hypothetical protein
LGTIFEPLNALYYKTDGVKKIFCGEGHSWVTTSEVVIGDDSRLLYADGGAAEVSGSRSPVVLALVAALA